MDSIANSGHISATLVHVEIQPYTDRTTHQVFLRYETPFTAVITSVTIITHRKVLAVRHFPLPITAAG
jgi:hypothetical protein